MASAKLSTKAVGSIIKLNLNSSPKNFIVVHQGKPSSLYDDSCDGTWLLMQDIYSTRQWDGSNNDYKNSDIHSWLNGTFLNLFDANIREAIKQVKIPYHNGTGSSGSVASGANGLSCKIFLLSGYELGWTKSDNSYFPQDGAKLDYFTAGTGSAANKKRIAKYNGSATYWWTRSPYAHNYNNVWNVYSNGGYSNWSYSFTNGVRPAFVLPSTLSVSDDGTVSTNEPPTAPGSIEVTGIMGGGSATITLTAATDPDGTVASYVYERSVDGGQFVRFANVNSLTQTDSILATWGTVAYRAKAVDNEGVSGPYATAAAETVNGGWILIGGPISNLGVQGGLFNLPLNIGVSGNTGVTGINLQVLQDGIQVYNNAVNQGDVINIPVDTRAMASGQHQIQAIADKDTFLAANVAWLFMVPSMALPDGGRIEQAQNADGEPIFFTTTTRAVIGPDGKSAQTQIDEINRSHQGITGHLAFVDAVMGPNASYVLARAAATTYAYQYYAPAAAEATGAALVSVYPGYNGAVGDLLTAVADTLTFNIPANGLLSIYQYNLDATDPPNTDPTANFVTLDQPHVVTADTNTGNTADGLEDALTAMMRAFPSRNYYALNDAMDPDATYYVVSQAVIGPDTASATVAYVSSANPTTWYQGVQITLMNTSNIPALFDYIHSPVVSAATTDNPVVAGANLNATLATMIKAQPTYLRYQIESSTGALYYVCSPTAIAPETVSAINVLYCTASGTYYNGESLTLAPPTDPTPEVTE